MNKKHIAILTFGGIIIVAMLLILVFVPAPSEAPSVTDTTGTTTDTELVEIAPGVIVELPEGLSAEDIVLEEVPEGAIVAPDLQRQVNIPDVFPEDAKVIMAKRIANVITSIEADPTSFAMWLELGNLRKQIADYEGAIEVYEYLNQVVPDNDIAHLNAANTYHLNLQEYEKAEENFEIAIKNNITNVLAYISFHELYKFSYMQDTNRAVEVLEEGIKQTEDPTLYIALGVYYRDLDMNEKAREALEDAQDEIDGNPQLQQLSDQIDLLLNEL